MKLSAQQGNSGFLAHLKLLCIPRHMLYKKWTLPDKRHHAQNTLHFSCQ